MKTILSILFLLLVFSCSQGNLPQGGRAERGQGEDVPGKEVAGTGPSRDISCDKHELLAIGGVTVWALTDPAALLFESGMGVDADGSPRAYHPDGRGLDYLANAGKPGNWWALVTDNGRKDGNPVVQGPGDPAPGCYISMTSLQDTAKALNDPARYVDSETVPYVVLPPTVMKAGKVKLGDLAVVYNRKNGKAMQAILADIGPNDKIGEGSIMLATALEIPSDPKRGGASAGIVYLIFPGSGDGKPKTPETIRTKGNELFYEWGGMERLRWCLGGM